MEYENWKEFDLAGTRVSPALFIAGRDEGPDDRAGSKAFLDYVSLDGSDRITSDIRALWFAYKFAYNERWKGI